MLGSEKPSDVRFRVYGLGVGFRASGFRVS